MIEKQVIHSGKDNEGYSSTPTSKTTFVELWRYRGMINQLVWRDLTVRYRQTWLGWIWALLNPALNMVVYYTIFGILIRVSSSEYQAPWALVLLCGLVIWMLFSSTLNATSESLYNNLHIIKKIWFPRSVLTIAATGVSIADFILMLLCLLMILPLNGISLSVIHFPLLLLCGALTAICGWGMGSILAIIRLKFRDARHLIPLLLQGLFYATPVVWTPELLPSRWHWLLMFDPLSGVLAIFRYALLAGPVPSLLSISMTVFGCSILALFGYLYFTRNEYIITDYE